jgi:hypothetical protein
MFTRAPFALALVLAAPFPCIARAAGAPAALARAKQASREIFGASEGLLKSPLELAAFYQQEVRAQRYYVWGAVLSALLALGGLLLLLAKSAKPPAQMHSSIVNYLSRHISTVMSSDPT